MLHTTLMGWFHISSHVQYYNNWIVFYCSAYINSFTAPYFNIALVLSLFSRGCKFMQEWSVSLQNCGHPDKVHFQWSPMLWALWVVSIKSSLAGLTWKIWAHTDVEFKLLWCWIRLANCFWPWPAKCPNRWLSFIKQ